MIDKTPQKQLSVKSYPVKAERLFSVIAPFYDLVLSRPLTSLYRKAIEQTLTLFPRLNPDNIKDSDLERQPDKTALDVGTGTGLLAAILADYNFTVSGIDVTAGMLKIAKRRRSHTAEFNHAPAHHSSIQPGAPFDLVCASMLMHGLPRDYRQQVLKDMAKASKHGVMIIDYSPHYRLITSIIESIEGSFYHSFLREFPEDLFHCYGYTNVLIHPLNNSCSLYVGYV